MSQTKYLRGIASSRQEAYDRGFDSYSTGEPCSKGHISSRLTDTEECKACLVQKRNRMKPTSIINRTRALEADKELQSDLEEVWE